MADLSQLQDLRQVDRDVRRGFDAHRRFRAALARDPDAHKDDDPFELLRYVAGQSTYESLLAITPNALDVPLRDALRRWVYALTQARIVRPLDVDLALALADPIGRFEGESPRTVSVRDAWRGVVTSRTSAEAVLWLAAAQGGAPGVAAAARERASRRLEIGARLGSDRPSDALLPVPSHVVDDVARTILDQTDDLASAVRREAIDDDASIASVIGVALARDAPEGWPSRLTPRWLDETLGRFAHGLSIDLAPLPAALGGASFARALYLFGHALRVASAPRALPFALAREPLFIDAHRVGFLFASLTTAPAFHRASLGTGRRVADAQSRVLARTALFDARLHAARWLLGDERDVAPRDRFEEMTARLFGASLPAAFAGAWPRARDDEAARLLALATAEPLARSMVEGFDVDWFMNPRAAVHLQSRASVPAHEALDRDAVLASATRLARALEAALA